MMGRNNFDLNILVLVSSFVSFFFLLKGHSFLCPSVMIEGIHFKFPVYDIKKIVMQMVLFFCYRFLDTILHIIMTLVVITIELKV